MKSKLLLFILLNTVLVSTAQESVNGVIYESSDTEEKLPLPGANVYWLGTSVGVVTLDDGSFQIPYQPESNQLVISFIGFRTDTIVVKNPNNKIEHWLRPSDDLDEVVIEARKQATAKSYLKAENIQLVSSDELLKAACCNLSESFETNPAIDVNFADAVSGVKQIKMLGLTSPYILIATENIPSIRGAAQVYGLSFIPGTWVESIQITKGAGSVINGFESIAGQINTELKKPSSDDPLFINAYASGSARLELNVHLNSKVSNKWNTGLYIHGNMRNGEFDRNDDNFLDVPLKRQLNVLNRWQYTDAEKGFVSFLNLRYLTDEIQSGEVNFDPETDRGTTNAWGSEVDTQRLDLSAKLGYVNPEVPWQSIGLQASYSYHNQESYFGLNTYDIQHNSLYANVIYNSIISDSRHKIKTGISFTYDGYNELVNDDSFERIENLFGGFFEYAYDDLDKITLTAGIRADQHNRLGFFITPRLHLRYSPWEKSAFRFSVGRGKRSANIFAENQSLFASNRQINILNSDGNIYGLDPEIAWNFGVSYLQGFNLFGRKADLTFDFYRTDFQNQVVVDWENPQQINFYNLQGSSFANSFQVELNYNIIDNVDIRTAYKYYDVQTDYLVGRLTKPLTPRNRVFANVSYETNKKENGSQWKFDTTFNWLSEQRFPSTSLNAPQFQLEDETPTVATLNAQVTRVFSNNFEVYLGGENINNYRQENPILGAQDPFGSNFDTNFVYGPIFGNMYYVGLRYKIK